MNARDQTALATLEACMPETDSRDTWEEALAQMRRRKSWLAVAVAIFGGVPIAILFAAIFFTIISFLPPNLHIGVRVGIGCGGGGVGCAMTRDLFAAIPGFGWAKELKRISDAVEPFQRHDNWLNAKDRFN